MTSLEPQGCRQLCEVSRKDPYRGAKPSAHHSRGTAVQNRARVGMRHSVGNTMRYCEGQDARGAQDVPDEVKTEQRDEDYHMSRYLPPLPSGLRLWLCALSLYW